jgi:replication factor A1
MKINELKAGASNVSIKATVAQKEDPREVVTKFGKRVSVATIVLKDDSGSINMSLWGNDINLVNVGDVVTIANGYVSEFRGTPQLSTGKFGKLTVVEKSGGGGAESKKETGEYAADAPAEDSEDF